MNKYVILKAKKSGLVNLQKYVASGSKFDIKIKK